MLQTIDAIATDKSGHVVKHEVSQDDSSAEANLDPKIRKGLERIRKLDAILADKLKVNYCIWLESLFFFLLERLLNSVSVAFAFPTLKTWTYVNFWKKQLQSFF